MIYLASRRKRPKGYVSIFTNVDTYYSHVCTFKNKKVTVVTTKETWEKLQELFEMYTKQVKKYKRHFVAWAIRDSVFAKYKETSLENSYLFRVFCNGFNAAYKYFFFDNICQMTSENAIKNQIKAYRNSARVPSLDFEPNEDSCSVSEFADYCFDLGQMTAAYYALAKFNLLEQKFKKVNNLHDFLKLDSNSEKSDDYIEKFVDVGLRYIKSEKGTRAKRAAAFIYHLNLKDDIKVRFPEDKNTKAYNYEIISFLWQEVHAEDVSEGDLKAKESFVKAVQRYLRTNDGKTLKIKIEDLQQFEKQLIESGL